jgi:tetratricopeptide (TPR) repeat protein
VGVSIHPAAFDSPPQLDWHGTERYEVVQCLGRGGMGTVYEARDRESRQLLALKTLLHATPATLYLFKQEFRTLADVDHPNLVRLHELVMTGADRVFFTMELVRGTDFVSYAQRAISRRDSTRPVAMVGSTAAKRTSPADFGRLRFALRQLVDGVMALHATRKLHRDIKPSNVLVTAEGRVVVLDFGVATEITRVVDDEMHEQHQVGTAAYMAPEQAFEEPTPACDWYAVGVMLYEALVGRTPFSGSVVDVLTMKSSVDPLPPSEWIDDVPADLDGLCRALLHREPAMRPQGAEILRRLGVQDARGAQPTSSGSIAIGNGGLAGRESHFRALHEAFKATLTGRTITVRLGGRSGIGKSAVANRFLDELVERGTAAVLRGRAYEREAVPYKAVDGLIDSVSRYMMCLSDEDLSVALPRDAWALARLFPVLRRVPSIGVLAEEPVTDPQRVRRRAFLALRELLASLARRRPLVLFVDDVQWGDTDSAALLLELTRPPYAPPLLLLLSYREEEELTSPFLVELAARWPAQAEMRTLHVGELDVANARRLALALLGSEGDPAQAMAESIARESGGSPFLVEELARSVASEANIPAHAVAGSTLEQMVGNRLARLPDGARRLLEIVAVAGRPVPLSVATEASGSRGAPDEVISLLRSRRFVRAGLRDGREVLEVIHGRIRDTIVAQLAPADVREKNGRLAKALQAAGSGDAEALAAYLLGAGQRERAAEFAERAAEQAVVKLAFDQAADLLRLTIEALPPSSPDGYRLRKRLGEVLEWAGRSAEAGHVYLEAAEGAPELQKLDLQRAAAEQLHASGLMDEGTKVLYRVLAAMGMRAPRSPLASLVSIVISYAWLRIVGVRFREREPRPEARLRLDALYAVALGFPLVNNVLSIAMKMRVLVAALRAGDRLHVVRSAALVASDLGGYGGPQGKTERALWDLAKPLAEKEPNVSAKFTVRTTVGVTFFLRGQFREAKAALDPIQAMTTNRRVGQQSALLFTLYSLQFLGELKELTERYARTLAEAEERGNLFVSVATRTGVAATVWLAADDPDSARRDVREAMSRWAYSKFSSPEWRAVLCDAEIDLYAGDAKSAYERVEGLSATLRKNLFVFVHYVRVLTRFIQGRAAIASLRGLPAPLVRARLDEARHHARRIERERMPWSGALASIVRAGIAKATGDLQGAGAALRTAIEVADGASLVLHASAARHELGLLLGGADGAALVQEAGDVMTACGVRAPSRYAAMLVPGVRP